MQCRKHIPDHPPFKPNTPITTHEPRPPFLPRQGSSSLIRGTNRRRSSFYVCTADPPAVHRIEVGAPPVKQQPSITRLDRALPHVAAINDSGAPRASPSRVSPDTDGPSPRDGRPRSLARTVGNPVKPLRREDRPPRGSEFRFPRSPAAPRASNKHYYFPPASQLAPPFELAYMSLLLAVALFATHIPACQRRPP